MARPDPRPQTDPPPPADEAGEKTLLLDVLAEEFVARHRRGESPSVDEYACRHPALADPLRELLPTLAAVEGCAPTLGRPDDRALVPPGLLAPPTQPGHLGRLRSYDVVGVVGRGGMGVVLKAIDTALRRPVAIKVLAPELAAAPAARAGFLFEARAAAAVVHEHVVTIHAVDEAGGHPYLVMGYVAGASLQDRVRRGEPLPPAEVARIGREVALGLAAAHARGVVHRDIKPANILLEGDAGTVRITDFGLARVEGDDVPGIGPVFGTPDYMSPEQARGETVDHRADLFSLGAVLYVMATGRSAFRAESVREILRRVREDRPPPVREANPAVPAWLAAVVERLLEKDPAARYQSAAEAAAALAGPSVRVRRRWLVAAAVVCALAAPGVGRWAAAGGPDPAPPPDAPARERPLAGRHDARVVGLAFAPDGKRAASGALDHTLKVWDTATGAAVRTIRCPEGWGVPGVGFWDGGRHAVGSNMTGLVWAWDLAAESSARRLAGHRGTVWAAAELADGRLATAGQDATVRVWDVRGNGPPVVCAAGDEPVSSVAGSPDGRLVAGGTGQHYDTLANTFVGRTDYTVRVWDAATGREVHRLVGHRFRVDRVAFAPAGDRLLSCGCDGTARVWDVATGRELACLKGHIEWVLDGAFSADGRRVVTVGRDGTARAWDAATGAELDRAALPRALAVRAALSADGRLALCGFDDGTLSLAELPELPRAGR